MLPLTLPPLRAHIDDVPALVSFYVDSFNREFKKSVRGASPATLELLASYGWPGNVRELRNAVERAMLLTSGDTLEPADSRSRTAEGTATHAVELPPQGLDLDEIERSLVAAGARAHRVEPDAGRQAARPQSRSDPLPDREVQARPGRAKNLNIAILL